MCEDMMLSYAHSTSYKALIYKPLGWLVEQDVAKWQSTRVTWSVSLIQQALLHAHYFSIQSHLLFTAACPLKVKIKF